MQIPPNDNNNSKKIQLENGEISKLTSSNKDPKVKKNTAQQSNADSVSVSKVSQAIQNELNPEKMQEERNAYIAQIKKLVDSGEYFNKRSTKDVAESFIKEIFFESQLASPDNIQTEDEELL